MPDIIFPATCIPDESFDEIVNNGIFLTEKGDVSQNFKVTAANGMNISINAGKGYFEKNWFYTDNNNVLQISNTNVGYRRIDSVLLQIDLENERCNIVYRTGTEDVSPTQPEITITTTVVEYRVANIIITSDSIESIIDFRGTSSCPWLKSKIPDTFSKIVNVVQSGLFNDGTVTDLSVVIEPNESNVIYYFPKGTYKIKSYELNNLHNITFLAVNAKFISEKTFKENKNHELEEMRQMLLFNNCTNCKVIGGVYDGNYEVQRAITFLNSKNSEVRSVEVTKIGGETYASAAGICLMGNCSCSKLISVTVHDVQSGRSAGAYIYASGLSITSASDGQYSKNIVIDNPEIFNIGTALYTDNSNNPLKIDGDGIFIIQRPEYIPESGSRNEHEDDFYDLYKNATVDGNFYYYNEYTKAIRNRRYHIKIENCCLSESFEFLDDRESFIKILNPHITDCSKRGIKVSARCVDIIGGIIDVTSWGPAVEYQYTRNSTVRNLTVTNNSFTCLSLSAGDGIVSVENCRFSGNGSNNGIVLGTQNKDYNHINKGGENVIISNCDFEDFQTPILAYFDSTQAIPAVSESIVIRNCTIGYFSGGSAILISPIRFQSLKKLKISDIVFKNGNSIADVFSANEFFYGQTVQDKNLINLGNENDHVNPTQSLIIDIDCLTDDFYEIFQSYNFTTKNLFLGGTCVVRSEIFEIVKIATTANASYTSNPEGTDLSVEITNDHLIHVTGGSSNVNNQFVYIPIKNFPVLKGIEYVINVETSVVYPNGGLTLSLYNVSHYERIGSEIALNGQIKTISMVPDNSNIAEAIQIKLKPYNDVLSNTIVSVSITTQNASLAGMNDIIIELLKHERRISALESLIQ